MTATSDVALWLTWFPEEVTIAELVKAYPKADIQKAIQMVEEYKELRRSNRLN